MDFEPENIVDEHYWSFGSFVSRDGKVDYKKLREDLEQIEYYLAAIVLETVDGEFFARLCQDVGYKWIFEVPRTVVDRRKCFEDFINGSVFKKFQDFAPEKIRRGFEALEELFENHREELERNSVDVELVENLISISKPILNKMDYAFDHITGKW